MVHGHSFHHGKTAAALGQISEKKKKLTRIIASTESQRAKDIRRTDMLFT